MKGKWEKTEGGKGRNLEEGNFEGTLCRNTQDFSTLTSSTCTLLLYFAEEKNPSTSIPRYFPFYILSPFISTPSSILPFIPFSVFSLPFLLFYFYAVIISVSMLFHYFTLFVPYLAWVSPFLLHLPPPFPCPDGVGVFRQPLNQPISPTSLSWFTPCSKSSSAPVRLCAINKCTLTISYTYLCQPS
jgi:hypothetical protein